MKKIDLLRNPKCNLMESMHYRIPHPIVDLHKMNDFLIYSGANCGLRFSTKDIQSILVLQKKLKSIYRHLQNNQNNSDLCTMFFKEYKNIIEFEVKPLIQEFRSRRTFQTFSHKTEKGIKQYPCFLEVLLTDFANTNHQRTLSEFSFYLANLWVNIDTLPQSLKDNLKIIRKASLNFKYSKDSISDYQNSFYEFLKSQDDFKNWDDNTN